MADVLVAGAGAVGQWLATRLVQSGQDVTVLTRDVHAQVLRGEGLRIHGHTEAHVHLDAITSVNEARRKFSLVVVTAKAHATAELAPQLASILAPGGGVVSLQNGFGNAAKLARHVPAARLAVASMSHGLDLEAPGRIHHAGLGTFEVAAMAPRAAATQPLAPATATTDAPTDGPGGPAARFQAMVQQAKLEPAWRSDARVLVWRKGLLNHAINPVATLAGVRNGELAAEPLRARCLELLGEGHALSRAAGVGLGSRSDAEALWATVVERTAANRNSMRQDLERKRPTEVEQITGYLVRLARRLGYPAPLSEGVLREVKAAEAAAIGKAASDAMTRAEVAAVDLEAGW